MLGPDFTSDLLEVETSDHCRMNIGLSYNWYFDTSDKSDEAGQKIFAIKDFIGDMCTIMASKIRGAVAGVNFEDFHKSSAKLIRSSIFGVDNTSGKIKDQYVFKTNGLTITNVDIKFIEPVDQQTKDALKQTVSLAIECVTQQQEDEAMRAANHARQEAEGRLERMRIHYQTKAEKGKMELLRLQADSRSIKESGEANAQAQAKATSAQISSEAKVELGKLSVQADEKMSLAEHNRVASINGVKIDHQDAMSKLRIHKLKELNDIEATKFEQIMGTLGQETLVALAKSGMETQLSMLEGLGLKGYLLTDGQTPINLFNAADGLIKKN